MILEKQKEALILETSINNDSIDMSLDMESASILMQMLSKTLYSDPIGSTIREWTSNALDSHRRINSEKPVIVLLQENEQGNYEFSVEDFGTGLLEEEVYSILSKYGKSTKRDKANELGAFGLN